MAVQTQIQTRRGTAASWTSTNPTLAAGEIGFESDTGKIKIGTGSTAWNALAYTASSTAVTYLYNATSGQTTFSGADANGLTLAYTVGAEQVYLNGVLQVRGSDYTATNGTSIVLTSGALVSDVLNVIAFSALALADTYTQAQADAKFYQLAFNGAAGKNAVINGGMDVWQRGTTSTAIGSGTFLADRWQASRVGFAAGASQSRQITGDTTNLPFVQYCLRVQRDSGNTSTANIIIGENFESVNSTPYAGKTVTMSFYARAGANYSSTSSALVSLLASGTGTDQNWVTSGTLTGIDGTYTTHTLTTTWQRFTITKAVASTATQLVTSFYYSPTGTAGANDYFEITGVQVELGSIATAFARAGGSIAGELAACQRYYYRVTGTGTDARLGTMGGAALTSICDFNIAIPVTMRSTITTFDNANLGVYQNINNTNYSGGTWTILTGIPSAPTIRYTHGSGVFTQGTTVFPVQSSGGTGYIGLGAEL